MNWRTTGVLFFLLLVLGGIVYWQQQAAGPAEPTPTPALGPGTFAETVPLLPDVAIDDVQRLEVSRDAGKDRRIYEQENGIWTQTVPTTTQVLSPTIVTPLQSLLDAGSRRTLSPDANPLEAYGLAKPGSTIVVAVRREGATARHTFFVGNLTPAGDAFYLHKAGDPRVHIVTSFPINNILELLPDP